MALRNRIQLKVTRRMSEFTHGKEETRGGEHPRMTIFQSVFFYYYIVFNVATTKITDRWSFIELNNQSDQLITRLSNNFEDLKR